MIDCHQQIFCLLITFMKKSRVGDINDSLLPSKGFKRIIILLADCDKSLALSYHKKLIAYQSWKFLFPEIEINHFRCQSAMNRKERENTHFSCLFHYHRCLETPRSVYVEDVRTEFFDKSSDTFTYRNDIISQVTVGNDVTFSHIAGSSNEAFHVFGSRSRLRVHGGYVVDNCHYILCVIKSYLSANRYLILQNKSLRG